MKEVEESVKEYLMRLDPRMLGLDHSIEIVTVRKIGLGESNLNYLANVDGMKLVVRINMDPNSPNKSKDECESLRIVRHLGIAPKVFHFEPSKEYVGETFIIMEYVEGTALDAVEEIDQHTVKKLGNSVAHLHNSDIERIKGNLRKHSSSRSGLLSEIERRIRYIKAKREIYFDKEEYFTDLFERPVHLLKRIKFYEEPCYVLGHGDICPQNVIVSQGDLRFIDWEDLGLIDSALEIAIIFDAFDFSERQREAFLEGYSAVREDRRLRRRIAEFLPFQIFGVFCWAIMHVYEIGEGEMNEAFLREQDLEEHIDYAQKMFNKCRKEKIIDKGVLWDAPRIFLDRYLST